MKISPSSGGTFIGGFGNSSVRIGKAGIVGTDAMSRRAVQSPRRRPRILLAMGFPNHERQLGIIRYARRSGWILDARLFAFHASGQDLPYLESSHFDGVLALCSRAAPWLRELVGKMRIPVVDMWADYPELRVP